MIRQLHCRNCDTPIPAEAINIQKALAKCPSCDCVFSFEEDLKKPPKQREALDMPAGIEILKLRSSLDIYLRWKGSKLNFLTIFTVIWDIVVFPITLVAIIFQIWFMLAVISIHLIIAIVMTYLLVARHRNTVEISVNEYRVKVKRTPLPVPFMDIGTIDTAKIDQLFCQQYISSKTNGQPNFSYKVMLRLKNGATKALIKGLGLPEQALYIEQEMERFLKITDRREPQEWSR